MSRYAEPIKWISWAVIAASLLVLLRALPLGDAVAAMREWVAGLGVWGPLVFGLIYIVAVVAMIPASLLTLAGGATFGLVVGTITVSLASTTGAALALLIARYLARGRVERFAQQSPRFAAIDSAISEGGWKIVAMLRLSPAVPFNVQNYLYGLTSIGFWTCVLTSWIAMLPGTLLYVYLGHAAGSITGVEASRTPAEWAFLVIGLLATVGVTHYITRLAQRKLREQTAIEDAQPAPAGQLESDQPGAPASGSVPVTSDANPEAHAPGSPIADRPRLPLATAGIALLLATLAGLTLTRPQRVTSTLQNLLPLGPPAVTMTEQYADASGTAEFDHSTFDALLQQYVDDDGWVDYEGLAADPTPLDAYLQSLAGAPFAELGRDQKLALLINAYNAFTLRLILDHWPVESIKEIPIDQRWDAERWNVGGHVWSLNQLEHEQIRPNFREPRIHFALVCAAIGCPPLANQAYTAENLDSQLQRQAEYVHAHGTWLQVDPEQRTVQLTPLYQWYGGDFEQTAGGIVDFAAGHNQEFARLLNREEAIDVGYLPYDWSLNSRSNRRPR